MEYLNASWHIYRYTDSWFTFCETGTNQFPLREQLVVEADNPCGKVTIFHSLESKFHLNSRQLLVSKLPSLKKIEIINVNAIPIKQERLHHPTLISAKKSDVALVGNSENVPLALRTPVSISQHHRATSTNVFLNEDAALLLAKDRGQR